jgi:hypothetical protein
MNPKEENFSAKARSFMKKLGWVTLLLLVLTGAGYYFYRTYTYSEGSRTGTIIKMSKKGNIFKTFEGELHMDNSLVMNKASIFKFSVKNEMVYEQLIQAEGKKVRLYYKEIIDAFPWQGETNYFIYKFEVLKE